MLAALAVGAAPASAQDDPSPTAVSDASQRLLEEGIEAFRDDRFDAAKSAFERAIEKDGENAEAYYMLSRVYYESPLFDKGEAGKAIGQARKLQPSNIEYMVAQLQQLRLPSWNNVAELIQQQERRALAEQILSVDSTNAFAHEELGASYIRDFWQYRNAIALPTLKLPGGRYDYADDIPDEDGELILQGADPDAEESIASQAMVSSTDFGSAQSIDLTDRFDIATLQAQGVGVLDLSRRADVAYDAAIGHLEKALQYDPRRRPVYDHLMRIFTLKEEYGEALEMLGQMLVFFPDDPQMWALPRVRQPAARPGGRGGEELRRGVRVDGR